MMADDRPEESEPSPDLGRSKRAGPTIDLEATTVSETPGAGPTGSETPPDPVPRAAPWVVSAWVSATAGAIAAMLVAVLVLGIVWLLGWPIEATSPATVAPQASNAAIDTLSARVANVESKVESKTATPQAAASDSAVATRTDALEKAIASLREELSLTRSRSERLIAAVDELKAVPKVAPPPDLSPINERLAEIERTTRAQITETAQQSAKPADDKPLRRVVAAALLDVSVRNGEPYAAALDAAKALAPDASVLKPLDAFATSGVPRPGALSRDLLALLPKPAAPAEATATTTGTGIVERLQAGAARLVRIRRTDAGEQTNSSGMDRTAVIVRAAAAAQRNDIAGARRELNTLSGADRAAVQSGIDRLDARDAALAASRQFAADAMAALSKPAP